MRDTDARQNFKRMTENLALATKRSSDALAPQGKPFHLNNQRGWLFPGFPRITGNALWTSRNRRTLLIDLVHELKSEAISARLLETKSRRDQGNGRALIAFG